MFISVPQKTGMWGLGYLWATCDDPRPLKIDFEDLSKEHKKTLKIDLKQGRIFEVDADGKRIVKEQREPIKQQVPIFEATDEAIEGLPPVVLQLVKKFLNQGVVSIRKNLDKLDTAIALAGAIALEKKDKNRKTVITLLEEKLSKSKDLSKAALFRTANMYDALVEEEEGETITLDVGELELSHVQEETVNSSQEQTASLV